MARTRHRIAATSDLAEDGDRVIAEVDGREIAVFRHDGGYYAVANHCVHQGGPLCEGELTGQMVVGDDDWSWLWDDDRKVITCPWHGWKFDVTDGVNIRDGRYRAPTYDVEVDDGAVYVYR